MPLALASAVVMMLFMSHPLFNANAYPHGDIFTGTFPQQRGGDHTRPMGHGENHTGRMGHGAGHSEPSRGESRHRSSLRQFTLATGYVALGLLALTLLIGPANLLLRNRNPISSYLSRDVGTWAAIGSVVHVIFGLQVHGSGRIRDFLNFFVAPDGSPLTNSFGLGNWTGLAALVIVVGLLAISSDAALRKLKAKRWKRLQRVNYALFALVIVHAFFYGALLRVTSPFTLLLGLSVIAVFVGQAVGVWLWRRRYSQSTMIIKHTCFSVVMLSSLGVLVPSTVLAQHGPGRHGPDSVQRQQGQDAHEGPAYDTTSEATFTGTVADVKTGRSALYWFARIHTLGLGHSGVEEKQLLLKTETGPVEIHLGPTAFLTERKVEIRKGDTVELTGSRVTIGEAQVVLAREIRKGDNTWTLRDATGRPLWSSSKTEARGFWTKKRVVLAIVAVKVVALATVLRH